MKQYCVAFVSFHENDIVQEMVWANSAEDAVKHSSFDLRFCFPEKCTTLEEAKCNAFDADCLFSVVEVT
jgi:hypothetical protein